MKSTLRTLPITILCLSLACATALAQVQPSPSGPVHSRFGFPMSGMKDRIGIEPNPSVGGAVVEA